MRGIPGVLNTRADVENCVNLALGGEIDKAELTIKIQDLLSDEKVWNFKAVVYANYNSSSTEKIIETKKEDGTIEYHCFELFDNSHAGFLRMGLTKIQIQNYIQQLQ